MRMPFAAPQMRCTGNMIRPLLRFALPAVLGCFVSVYLLPQTGRLWVAAVILLAGLGIAWGQRTHRAAVCVSVLGLALGTAWVGWYTDLFLTPLQPLIGTEQTVTLELLDYPEQQAYQVSCTARQEGVAGNVLLYGEEDLLSLAPGDYVTGRVKYSSASEIGGKQNATYLARGIVLRLYAKGEMTVEKKGGNSLRWLPQRMKRAVCAAADELYDEKTYGVVLAILTGEREALDPQSASDLEEAGLMHLTAVSGLHCGFFIALLSVLFLGNRYLKAWLGYPVLLFYMVMVGGTPSVVRACIMAAFPLAAPLVDRENDPPTSLSFAAMLILLVNPFAAASVSYQLSFAAAAGILWVTPRIYEGLYRVRTWKNRWLRRLWTALVGSISGSIGALVFTLPISAYYFKTIALVAPLSNLLVFPVMSVLFAAALLLTAGYMICPAVAPLASLVSALVQYILWAAGWTAALPGHAVSVQGVLTPLWLVLVYTLFALCAVSGDSNRKYAVAVVLSVLALVAVRLVPRETVRDDALTMVAVDVGQGAATLLHSGDTTALVDCGSHYSPRGSGACVVDAMHTYGWKAIDYLVLTHYHEDHAGGLDELLARTTVGTLLLPRETEESALCRAVLTLAARYGVAVEYVTVPTTVPLGTAVLTVYPQLTHGEVNEEGLTILCSSGEFDALFTGDMGESTEKQLVETYPLPDIEVLFVAHHGSKYSTCYEFLRAVTPEVGIISVGENSYGHPTVEAMERMAYYGMELYRTDWQGNILLQIHKK